MRLHAARARVSNQPDSTEPARHSVVGEIFCKPGLLCIPHTHWAKICLYVDGGPINHDRGAPGRGAYDAMFRFGRATIEASERVLVNRSRHHDALTRARLREPSTEAHGSGWVFGRAFQAGG